jgi:hypothetical protein
MFAFASKTEGKARKENEKQQEDHRMPPAVCSTPARK